MMNRSIAVTLSLALLACLGCGKGTAPTAVEGGSSPQDVFDQAKAAMQKSDWKAIYALADPQGRDKLLGEVVFALELLMISEEDTKAEAEGILKKHGLDLENMKPGGVPGDKAGSEDWPAELVKGVKDKAELWADMMAFISRHNKSGGAGQFPEKAVLKDLKIDGDRASGTMDKGDGETRPEVFVKRGDRWYLADRDNDRPASQAPAPPVAGTPAHTAPSEANAPHDPQAAFERAKAAVEKQDWKALFQAIDPPDREFMIFMMGMEADMLSGDDKGANKELDDIMKKHGMKDDKGKARSAQANGEELNAESMKKAAHAALEGVKDRPGLFTDLMAFVRKHDKDQKRLGGGGPTEIVGATLKDVKVLGDKATATMVKKDGKTEPMGFAKRKDSWYLSIK